MKEIISDTERVACCGLYCGACRTYIYEKCKSCRDDESHSWCKIRACCSEKGIHTCAECQEHPDPNTCRKYNNFISKVFGFIFKSDRATGIRMIREKGLQAFADHMASAKLQAIKK